MDATVNYEDENSITKEACRLGIMLFLGEVRRRCGVQGVVTTVYTAKLKDLLEKSKGSMEWEPFNHLLLWLLFFGLLESQEDQEIDWYAGSICELTGGLTDSSWMGALATVKRFLWFDNVFEMKSKRIQDIVVTKSTNI